MNNDFLNSIRNGEFNKIKKIIESNKNIINKKDKQGRTPLMEAIIFKKEEIAKFLIESGVNLNEQDNNGWSAMHFAVQEFLVDIIKLLIANKAIVDLKDNNGNTPLFRSLFSSNGRGDIITLLLDAGADKNSKNNSNISPYDLARQVTNFDLIKYFT